jgi:hypothetical protein
LIVCISCEAGSVVSAFVNTMMVTLMWCRTLCGVSKVDVPLIDAKLSEVAERVLVPDCASRTGTDITIKRA